MKTYNDGLLEAAKVCEALRAEHGEKGNIGAACLFRVARDRIRALAAQEDKPQEHSADDLKTTLQAHIQDLRKSVPTLIEYGLDAVAVEFNKAASEIETAIDAHLNRKEV